MARQRRKLGHYIKDRKEKYRKQKIPKFLVHVSLSPHRILFPMITPFAWETEDVERTKPLLFLSPVQEISNWIEWCYFKQMKRVNAHGYSLLYIHIIRTHKEEIFIPQHRYCEEFVTTSIQKPVFIVPIRYYPDRYHAELHPVSKRLKMLKRH